MNERFRRTARTVLQLVLALLGSSAAVGVLAAAGVDVTAEQWLVITGVLTPVVTYLQNWVEDQGRKVPGSLTR